LHGGLLQILTNLLPEEGQSAVNLPAYTNDLIMLLNLALPITEADR